MDFSKLTFLEQAPWEKGFSVPFQHEVVPQLRAQDMARRRALRMALFLAGAVLVLALIAAIVAAASAAGSLIYLLIALLSAALTGGILWLFNRLQREAMSAALMPIVCRFLGFQHARSGEGAIDPSTLANLGVVPAFTKARLEDSVTGSHRNTPFTMVEVKLSSGSGRRRRTAFRGLLLQVGVPVAFSARVLLQRDYGKLGNQLFESFGGAKGMSRVAFEDPNFEAAFEVFSDQEAEARRLLSPALLQALLQLRQAQRREGLTAAFAEGRFTMALPVKRNLFEVGSLFQRPDEVVERLHDLIFEMTTARRIIDVLHGDPLEQVLS